MTNAHCRYTQCSQSGHAKALNIMFIVASTGRCGTMALCGALDAYSDHRMQHEQEPLLLAESYYAWAGKSRLSSDYLRRMRNWHLTQHAKYGEAVRCAALITDIARAARQCRVLFLFRKPLQYLHSAWGRGVMRKGDIYDRYRILPPEAAVRSPVDQILFHFAAVNSLLAEAARRLGPQGLAIEVGDLDQDIERMTTFLGVRITNRQAVSEQLATRLNAGPRAPWTAQPLPEPSADAMTAAELAYRNFTSLASNGNCPSICSSGIER